MDIHECQAKMAILEPYGVKVPNGIVITNRKSELSVGNSNLKSIVVDDNNSLEQAITTAYQQLNSPVVVVKSQIHAGGRGKGQIYVNGNSLGNGVVVAKNLADTIEAGKMMLGNKLVTYQTGPEGQTVHHLYLEEGVNILHEYYISLVIDRTTARVAIMVSAAGGMDIEEVAHNTPENIKTIFIDPITGVLSFHTGALAKFLSLSKNATKNFAKLVNSLYQAFINNDASQIEINPLIITDDEYFIALDAKINIDDNALFRMDSIREMRDEHEEDPREIRAAKAGLSYVPMPGNIGCMVNGAGLAMATMDIIGIYGESPANFLDVGGGANKERVSEAFKIILSDEKVKAILVNIFGGIMRCDIIAEGIVAAAKEVGITIPLVVRLAGTNFELGRKILSESTLDIVAADNLADAARKVVEAIK